MSLKFDIKIVGSITESKLHDFLYLLEGKRQKNYNIFLHSSGGDVDVAWAIKSLLETNKIHTTIYCSRVESAANTILSAGKRKIAYKHCSFMFHQATITDNNTNKKVTNKELKKRVDKYHSFLENIFNPIKLKPKVDQYFTADEMLKMGHIDEII